ncbi:PTS sugar transporter subunit IIC [Entomospira culicis]|uniref:Permease IIC component n=1 Tax=Entomospira culicis TaxID=2719989 RepID=A0A968GH66_9SPIO|nr:PTS transporter subunit EIIC [Entomospira culicis]NIZ18742.1 PTS sugar transporter subunit IIC [Entomospira culicis]NIZ68957.1 PTS sugar transporter subunit IIC [Entomospira culicis]WDI37549.1 PTS transporter subunit EIIC [Entomospira culicis]WDI39177.1 PTS transporter subunit EIIC [Entomospira culicis]
MSSEQLMENKFLHKFILVSTKISEQIHLRSMKDGFVTMMPLFILAGLAVLINNVILPIFLSGEILATVQEWGTAINNGTLNMAALGIAILIAYNLAKNRQFINPIATAVVALGSFMMILPLSLPTPIGDETVQLNGLISFNMLGSGGMISAIVISILASELFIFLSKVKIFKIYLGEGVPTGVARSFEALIPVILTMSTIAASSLLLKVITGMDLMSLIVFLIQRPLQGVNNSLIGFLFLYGLGTFLFSLGIHHNVITSAFIGPFLLININENMIAFSEGVPAPHILVEPFMATYMNMSGHGLTLPLLIAIFLFSKDKQSRTLGKLSIGPALFNINEPVIFGYPIIFNPPMMIPFVLVPLLGGTLAYFATALGLVNRIVVMLPWTTPPILSGYLATGGDWRASLLQIIIIVMGVFIYLPFMKMNEMIAHKIAMNSSEK